MRHGLGGVVLLAAATLLPGAARAVNMSIEEVGLPNATFESCLARGGDAIRAAGLRNLPPGTRSRGGENDARDQLYVVYCTTNGTAVVIGSGPQDSNVGPMVTEVVNALRGRGPAPRPGTNPGTNPGPGGASKF